MVRINWNKPSFTEMELLAQHGVLLPPNMQGLTEEQVDELKLKDEFAEVCIPSGGFVMNPDPVGRRNGRGKAGSMQAYVVTLRMIRACVAL